MAAVVKALPLLPNRNLPEEPLERGVGTDVLVELSVERVVELGRAPGQLNAGAPAGGRRGPETPDAFASTAPPRNRQPRKAGNLL